MKIDPNRAVDELIRQAPIYAKAKADRVYVEEFRKTLKAQLMKQHASLPIGAQEREAYADDSYIVYLQAIRDAVEAEEASRWIMVAAQARIDVWRSQESSARNQIRATT